MALDPSILALRAQRQGGTGWITRRRNTAVVVAPVVEFTIPPSIVGNGKIGTAQTLNLGVAPGATLIGVLSRGATILISNVLNGQSYTPTGDDDLTSLTLTVTATIGAVQATAAATKAITYVAPVFSAQPTISPSSGVSGAVFALTLGTATPAAALSIEYFRLDGISKSGEIAALLWNSTGENAGPITFRVRAENSGGVTLSTEMTATLTAVGTPTGPSRLTAPTVAPNAPVKEGVAQTVTPGTYAVSVTITHSWQANSIERGTGPSYTAPVLTYRNQELVLVETAVQAGNPTPTISTVSLGLIFGVPTSAGGSLEFNVTANASSAVPNLTPTASAIVISKGGADHTQIESTTLMTWNAGDLVVVSVQGRRTSLSLISALINSVTVGAAARAYGTGTLITERGLTNVTGSAKPVFGMYAIRMASAGSGYLQIDWNMNGGAAAMEATHAHYWAIPNTDAVTPVLEYVTTQNFSSTAAAISLSGDPAEIGELLIGGAHVGLGGVGFAASAGTLSDQGFTEPTGSSNISAAYLYHLAVAADVTANTHSISLTYTPAGASFGAALRIQPA